MCSVFTQYGVRMNTSLAQEAVWHDRKVAWETKLIWVQTSALLLTRSWGLSFPTLHGVWHRGTHCLGPLPSVTIPKLWSRRLQTPGCPGSSCYRYLVCLAELSWHLFKYLKEDFGRDFQSTKTWKQQIDSLPIKSQWNFLFALESCVSETPPPGSDSQPHPRFPFSALGQQWSVSLSQCLNWPSLPNCMHILIGGIVRPTALQTPRRILGRPRLCPILGQVNQNLQGEA